MTDIFAVGVHLCHVKCETFGQLRTGIHVGLDGGTFGVEHLQIERVVALKEARAQHVEDCQLAVLVLVQREVGAYPQSVQAVVQIGAPHQSPLVQRQTVSFAHHAETADSGVGRHVEALETAAREVQALHAAQLFAGALQLVFQLVGESCALSLRIEFEEQQSFIVPVIHVVGEAQRVAFTASLTAYADIERVVVALRVDEEVARHVLHHRALPYSHPCLVFARASAAVIDTEAEQVVVAHLPKQALVCPCFHPFLFEHRHDAVHIDQVARYGAAGDFFPLEVGVLLDSAHSCHVTHIVGEIQVEILCRKPCGKDNQK